MGDFIQGYVIGDAGGPSDFLPGADLVDAVGEARSRYRGKKIYFRGDLEDAEREDGRRIPAHNPPHADPRNMPLKALKASGLERISLADVERMGLREAWEKLVPIFRIKHKIAHGGVRAGDVVKAYESPNDMKKIFLTENAKLAKGSEGARSASGVPVKPGYSRGPNLAPHAFAKEHSKRRLPTNFHTLCVGSNKACREACLVYSGNNPVADAQVDVKLARTEALLLEPVAWMRMMLAATEWHLDWCKERGLRAYLRPNVLSDIPWELVFPEMFGMFPGLTWYDYTKVAGREIRKDYDLTFSFSGTNDELCASELRRGRRIAVVFYLPNACRGDVKKRVCRGLPGLRNCDLVTDLEIFGRRVLDGDCHDFRPLDPGRSIIGLTYKVPTDAGKRLSDPKDDKFVLRATYSEEARALTVPGVPSLLSAWDVFEGQQPTEVFA